MSWPYNQERNIVTIWSDLIFALKLSWLNIICCQFNSVWRIHVLKLRVFNSVSYFPAFQLLSVKSLFMAFLLLIQNHSNSNQQRTSGHQKSVNLCESKCQCIKKRLKKLPNFYGLSCDFTSYSSRRCVSTCHDGLVLHANAILKECRQGEWKLTGRP